MTDMHITSDIVDNIPHANVSDANTEQAPTAGFDSLGLAKPLLAALAKSGYSTPTPIQAGAIPLAMAGHDLLLSAQTGSGKTAAFVLPILDKLAKTGTKPKFDDEQKDEFSTKSASRHQKIMTKALILTPTRELALQVQDNVRNYGGALKGVFSVPLVGGAPYGGQIRALRKGVQIIVATPGRLLDHINDERVDLSELDILVLDEADRMLDMGFSDAINAILAKTPDNRQTIMSSATWDGPVGKIAASFTTDPKNISIKVETAHIEESVYYCDDFGHKNQLLLEILNNPEIDQAVIFAATKRSSEKLAEDLADKGYKARYLHGDLPQGKRNRIIQDVKAGKCQFLIATDVAARGIDIATISHVINYDLPRQVEDYVHRIGRSGRAGRTGVAINLCSLDDKNQLREIGRYLKREMPVMSIEGLEPRKLALFESNDRPNKKGGRSRGRDGGRNGSRDGGRGGFGGGRGRGDYQGGRNFGDNRGRGFESRGFGDNRRNFDNAEREFHRGDNADNRQFNGNRGGFGGERRFDDNRRGYNERGERGNFAGNGYQRSNHNGDRRVDSNRGERSERSFERQDSHQGSRQDNQGGRGYHSRFDNSRSDNSERPRREYGTHDRRSHQDRNERGFGGREHNRGERGFGERSFDGRRQDNKGGYAGNGNGGASFNKKPFTKKPRTTEEVFFEKRQAKKARKFGDE
ncbi:MAG: DEAD/DEAH box helicase [Moraxella sp.]|nr:DEAD/DEAH box helicase [Moraxella sp.]